MVKDKRGSNWIEVYWRWLLVGHLRGTGGRRAGTLAETELPSQLHDLTKSSCYSCCFLIN